MTTFSAHPHGNPLTPVQEAAVRAELEAILGSHHFASSKRCQDLFQFVVNGAMQRDFDSLTERFIGARVFGRPIGYETATDAIVRVRANDVRRRLAQYYSELEKPSAVRIGLTSGSYVPEFHFLAHKAAVGHAATPEATLSHLVDPEGPAMRSARPWWRQRKVFLAASGGVLSVLMLAAWALLHGGLHKGPVEEFWAPVLHRQGDILICAGGNTFLQNPVPGFYNAGKEINYPYFSLQTEVATTLLSVLIERNGSTPQFRFAATTSLPDFHEHPIILLNAYNNQWTLRMSEALRFHFSPSTAQPQGILDRQHPEILWARDASQLYENSTDYALLARFWDKSTDNWVIVLAGLGRNGTEASARFVVDPQYMQELRERLGSDFSKQNIEVVLRVPVLDGKTGSPQIAAVHAW